MAQHAVCIDPSTGSEQLPFSVIEHVVCVWGGGWCMCIHVCVCDFIVVVSSSFS